MANKIHIALNVTDLNRSIADYSQRMGCEPCAVITNEYALWRTEAVNLSIRVTGDTSEKLRHLGWENDAAKKFTQDIDVNGITWESFSAQQQQEEINAIWPNQNSPTR